MMEQFKIDGLRRDPDPGLNSPLLISICNITAFNSIFESQEVGAILTDGQALLGHRRKMQGCQIPMTRYLSLK